MSLTNKVALVTGASSGIGAAIALKLAEEGARVALVGRNKEKLKGISGKCRAIGINPITIIADVSKDEDARRIIDETIRFFGQLDILVNNAATGPHVRLDDHNAMELFDVTMATNIRAVAHLTHLSIKYLKETKGNIVNISSIAAIVPMTYFPYCSSKAALDHFTKCAALELAPYDIRVNGINCGPFKTDWLANLGMNDVAIKKTFELAAANTLTNRVGEAEEVGDLVAFLASDKGRSLTGTNIVLDNGVSVKGPTMPRQMESLKMK